MARLNEDFPKVRTTDANELAGLLNYLLLMLNIKRPADAAETRSMDAQMLMIGDLIRTTYGMLTIPEIKEAFKMYVAGTFPDVKVFRIFDCISVGEVLNAFIEYRNARLASYTDKKKRTEEELEPEQKQEILIDGIMNCYDRCLEEKLVPDERYRVFNLLYEMEIVPKYDASAKILEAYHNKRNLAIKEIKRELVLEKVRTSDEGVKARLREQYKAIEKDDNSAVQHRFKALVLAGYFVKVDRDIDGRENFLKLVTENIHKIKL